MNKRKILIIVGVALLILALIIIGVIVSNNSNDNLEINTNTIVTVDNKEKVTIKTAVTKTIEYENYDNSLISLQIPKGWKVEIAPADYIHYTFKAYNPENPNYVFLFSLKLIM